jgi:hypothetical protein
MFSALVTNDLSTLPLHGRYTSHIMVERMKSEMNRHYCTFRLWAEIPLVANVAMVICGRAAETSKGFKACSRDAGRQLMEDCFFGRRFADGSRPSPPDGPTPLALHAQPDSLPFYRGAYFVSAREPGRHARAFRPTIRHAAVFFP